MHYENLKLRPARGSIDRDAITTWLAAKDYAFVDPLGKDTWHLSATTRDAEENREKLVANPTALQHSTVIVFLHPDWVGVNAYRVHRAQFRALEFIRWLVHEGEWDVQVDQAAWEPIGDPARLFPEGIDDKPDHTTDELAEGVRYTWATGHRTFIVHSGSQWRTLLRDETETWRVVEQWRGELSPGALAEWSAAVENAGDLSVYVDGHEGASSFEMEDLDGIETAWFASAEIPAPLKPLASLVERWLGELASWNESSTSADLLRVRRG
jgi:hypothetical protein